MTTMTRRNLITQIARVGGYSAAFSTMNALGWLPEARAQKFVPLSGNIGSGKKVVILGSGICGMVAAYELRKAGFDCTVLEARDRPGGRNWTIRNGDTVTFKDGTVQHCSWKDGLYFNAGPARIPSIHRNLLGYCEELGVPLEVEINDSRSALMQSDRLNGGVAVEQRQVTYDTRGHVSELFAKSLRQGNLDSQLTKDEVDRLIALLRTFGDLKDDLSYVGTERAGYAIPRGAGLRPSKFRKPLALHDLLIANLARGEFYEDRLDWQATMFQPVGGMDRIAYAFAQKLGGIIHYRSVVKEIRTTENGVQVAYASADGHVENIAADFCICTLPISVLRDIPNNFSEETKRAFNGMPMLTQYKIAWQAPRFWEKEFNIYGGLSFLDQPVDTVWYPSDKPFSSQGVLIAGFNVEFEDSGEPTAFGRLASVAAKLTASRNAIEKLHPGYGGQLSSPIYVSWPQIPYSLGCYANNHLETSEPAYKQLSKPVGNLFFAGDYLSRLAGWQEGATLSAHEVVEAIALRARV
jgi:monoamine oxidase